MANNMANALENALIDHIFRGVTYTKPTSIYVALCTTAPTDASTSATLVEPSGQNYSRVAVACDTTHWSSTNSDGGTDNPSSGTNGTTSNSQAITFPTVGALGWGTLTHLALCDVASGAGNVLFWGLLSVAKTPSNGDIVSFAPYALRVQIDGP